MQVRCRTHRRPFAACFDRSSCIMQGPDCVVAVATEQCIVFPVFWGVPCNESRASAADALRECCVVPKKHMRTDGDGKSLKTERVYNLRRR